MAPAGLKSARQRFLDAQNGLDIYGPGTVVRTRLEPQRTVLVASPETAEHAGFVFTSGYVLEDAAGHRFKVDAAQVFALAEDNPELVSVPETRGYDSFWEAGDAAAAPCSCASDRAGANGQAGVPKPEARAGVTSMGFERRGGALVSECGSFTIRPHGDRYAVYSAGRPLIAGLLTLRAAELWCLFHAANAEAKSPGADLTPF